MDLANFVGSFRLFISGKTHLHTSKDMLKINKFALAAIAVAAGAGIANAGQFSFGIKAGLNVNKLKFNQELASASNSCGWTAGVTADFTVPIIGIGADASIMYSRMNNAADVTYNDNHSTLLPSPPSIGTDVVATPSGSDIYGKNFLEIPINIKYKFNIPVVASVFKPYVFTGPQFGLRLDKSMKDVVNNIQSRTFQMNWNVGLGVELIGHLQVAASYGIGCTSVVKKLTESTTGINVNNDDVYKVKNNYWTVTAAWLF